MTPALPLISCLMATRGRFALAQRAASMFALQSYPADRRELVILHNSDEDLACEITGVRIHNERLPTLGDCRNLLLELARGDCVMTWDDDDWHAPHKLEQAVEYLGDAAAWKPARSWFWDGSQQRAALVANAMESSLLVRTEVARRYGYAPTLGDEHAPLLRGLAECRGLHQTEVGILAAYCYTWGCGEWHASGSLGSGRSLADRTRDWEQHATDHRPGAALQFDPAAGYVWRQILPFVPIEARADWERQFLKGHA